MGTSDVGEVKAQLSIEETISDGKLVDCEAIEWYKFCVVVRIHE
jgi:hypothetical protein